MQEVTLSDLSFGEWAKIHQWIGLNASLEEINWTHLHGVYIDYETLVRKEDLLAKVEKNQNRLVEFMERLEKPSPEVRYCARSIYTQYAQAIKDLKRAIFTIKQWHNHYSEEGGLY